MPVAVVLPNTPTCILSPPHQVNCPDPSALSRLLAQHPYLYSTMYVLLLALSFLQSIPSPSSRITMPSTRTTVPSLLLLLLPALALCAPSKRATCSYTLPDVGTFTNQALFTFDGDSLPAGLVPNTDTVSSTPFSRVYEPSLLTVSGGYLNFKVPGGQTSGPIRGAGVNSVARNILYASVRTKAIFSDVPGTVQSELNLRDQQTIKGGGGEGFAFLIRKQPSPFIPTPMSNILLYCIGLFFYRSDTAEIDLEFLSDPSSRSNPTGIPSLHYTNHGPTRPSTTADGINPGKDVLREYRIDWLPSVTRFYVDGLLQQELREKVPSAAGSWMWNHWSNGDREYSGGPPPRDSVMRIGAIEMWWNATEGMC